MGIKSRFCPSCGREHKQLVGNVCADCYFKGLDIRLPAEIKVQACPACDAVLVNGFWIKSDEDHESYFMQSVIDKLKLPPEVELEDVEILQTGPTGDVQLNISIGGKRFSVAKRVALYVTDQLCDEDSNRKREAFEGILQLRAETDVHGFLTKAGNILKNYASNVLKIEEQRNGADVYFLNKETMRKALGELKKKFSLYMKESAKAYSWERTKNRPKYKLTILARLRE